MWIYFGENAGFDNSLYDRSATDYFGRNAAAGCCSALIGQIAQNAQIYPPAAYRLNQRCNALAGSIDCIRAHRIADIVKQM